MYPGYNSLRLLYKLYNGYYKYLFVYQLLEVQPITNIGNIYMCDEVTFHAGNASQ